MHTILTGHGKQLEMKDYLRLASEEITQQGKETLQNLVVVMLAPVETPVI